MSYARFGCDGSDVYVYHDIADVLRCCACPLAEGSAIEHFDTPLRSAMLAHLAAHQAAGHHVPTHALAQLRTELETEGDGVA